MHQARITVLVLIVGLAATAQDTGPHNEFPSTSGNAYLRMCPAIDKADSDMTREDFRNILVCVAYTEGVEDGVNSEVAYAQAVGAKAPPKPFCLPKESENGQLVRVVLKYIRNHPEEAQNATATLIVKALRGAFPCR